MYLTSCYFCFFLIAVFFVNFTIAGSKDQLRHLASNKDFISRLAEGEFEVVHPFQIRDKNDRIGIDTRNHYLNGSVHYKQVTIVIRSTVVNRLKLLLGLNELLFINGSIFEKFDNDENIPINRRVENCYYQGTVNGEEGSFVALSTCNGLRGIIAFDNGSAYGIWPLDGGDRGRRHPHVLYRTKWSQSASCGNQVGENLKQFQKISKRDVTKQTKFVELAVIGDYFFMKKHDLHEEEGTSFILEAINIADYIFSRDLNIRLSVVYLEEWMDKSRIDYYDDIERTLSSAVEYITGHIYHIAKDSSLMFTSAKFVKDEVMTSTSGSICSSRATGLIKAMDIYTAHATGQLIAHNLAHIMGMDHDSPDCACNFINKCIMHKQAGTLGSPFLWQFSKCSIARMHSILQSGYLQCLLNKPLQASTLQQCGNGIIDGEEECDCGSREQCLDPCCDPLTCTLRAHAHCASHQACCHRCQLRPIGHVCRAARSVCDVAEMCTGDDGDCPIDGYLIDGTVCGISGQCWKGNCSDVEQQCRDLWGSDATTAEEHCYERNGLGLEYGNCGTDRDGMYKKCAVENVHCGTLHCRGGFQTPVNLKLNSFNLQFLHESKQIQCKMVTNLDVGVVMDGSSCGSGKVCIQGICSPLVQVSPPVHCPSNNLAYQCSGHGDCTTTRRCLCYNGWMGIACDTKTNITHFTTIEPSDISHFGDIFIPSFAGGHKLNTTTLLIILLIVGILLLLLLICLLFCYRRQSGAEFSSPVDEKLNESLPENTQRAIKFGSMPSYREEKRKRKKDKHVYDALQKINEANDERDSASVKSRESGTTGHDNNGILSMNRNCMEYDPREDIVTTMLNGTATTILKRDVPDNRNYYCDGVLYHEACSEMDSSPTIRCSSVALPARCERNRSGYATDSEIAMGRYGTRYVEAVSGASVELSPTSSQTSVNNRMTPTPLKLNNIGMLLRQLQHNDEVSSDAELSAVEADHVERGDLGSNTESSRGGYESQEANTMLPNGLDPNFSRSLQSKDRNGGDERLDSVRNCNNTSACFSNEMMLNGHGTALFQDCQSLSEIEMSERSTSHTHPHGQSQHSLFNDSFRLEV
ncbi:Disintegrin and metalloproteinase domain-containing protein [Dirofilaria immitis]